jgi:hypothetical protein
MTHSPMAHSPMAHSSVRGASTGESTARRSTGRRAKLSRESPVAAWMAHPRCEPPPERGTERAPFARRSPGRRGRPKRTGLLGSRTGPRVGPMFPAGRRWKLGQEARRTHEEGRTPAGGSQASAHTARLPPASLAAKTDLARKLALVGGRATASPVTPPVRRTPPRHTLRRSVPTSLSPCPTRLSQLRATPTPTRHARPNSPPLAPATSHPVSTRSESTETACHVSIVHYFVFRGDWGRAWGAQAGNRGNFPCFSAKTPSAPPRLQQLRGPWASPLGVGRLLRGRRGAHRGSTRWDRA